MSMEFRREVGLGEGLGVGERLLPRDDERPIGTIWPPTNIAPKSREMSYSSEAYDSLGEGGGSRVETRVCLREFEGPADGLELSPLETEALCQENLEVVELRLIVWFSFICEPDAAFGWSCIR